MKVRTTTRGQYFRKPESGIALLTHDGKPVAVALSLDALPEAARAAIAESLAFNPSHTLRALVDAHERANAV
ncbi:MAG: DUF1854 domain-containing protein [Bacteroidetes bacterium]|nr:DUF1854 domain-containing protein [Bacteroidota bacterium]